MLQRRLITLATLLFVITTLHAQVNLQTGSATFSLPMFNWQDTKSRLNAVVALSYSSGNGLKTDEVASNVGQGWNLTAGGVISRMQVGEPDDQPAYDPGGADGPERDIRKYPAGYLYAPVPAGNGCPNALTRYPIYGSMNQVYKQHNHVAADKQLDYFSFQFNGKAGTFVLKPGSTDAIPIGDTKMQISFQLDPTLNSLGIRTTIKSFTIKDVDGLIYRFGVDVLGLTKVLESNYCNAAATQKLTQPDMKPGGVYHQKGTENASFIFPWVVSSWYLKEIEDGLTGRKITFNYITRQINTPAGIDISYDSWHNYAIVTHKTSITRTPELTSIVMPDNHQVTFNYGSDRADLKGEKVLSSVDVTYGNRYISKYIINTTYFILNRYGTPASLYQQKMSRLCLRSVKKLGVDLKEDAAPYTFDYYTGSSAPDDMVPPPFALSRDVWGAYNGNNSVGFANSESISPTADIATLNLNQLRGLCFLKNGVTGVYLNPKPGYAKNGLLRQIIYPSGGTLTYEYAQNTGRFNGSGTDISVGGVHVSKTSSTDGGYSNGCNNPISNQYNFVMNGAGSASSMWGLETPVNYMASSMYYSPEHKYFTFNWNCLLGCCEYKFKYPGILSTNQSIDLTNFQRFMTNMAPVFGILSIVSTVMNVVTVITGPTGVLTWVALIVDVVGALVQIAITCLSDQTKQGTSIVYYNFDMNSVSPLPAQFKRVEVVNGSGSSGKTVQTFTSTDDYDIWSPTNPNFTSRQRFASWAYGLPKLTTVLDASGNKVRETENLYDTTYTQELIGQLDWHLPDPAYGYRSNLVSCKCLVQRSSSQRNTDWTDQSKYKDPASYQINSTNDLAVEFYPVYTGRTQLTTTKERVYKPTDPSRFVETVTHFQYNDGTPNYDVNSTSVTQSNGDVNYKYIRYSGELSGGAFTAMNNQNMVSVPIVTSESVNRSNGTSGYLHQTVTEFTQLGNGDIKPWRALEIRSDRPMAGNSPNWTTYSGPASTDYSKYKITQTFSYDGSSGNAIGIKDEGQRSISNIYDYADKYIVASVINADPLIDKPAYTSFETGSFGGWQVSGSTSAFIANSGITGSRAYNLAGCTFTAPLNTAKAYKLSFWASNNSVSVSGSGTPAISAPIINGYTYYEYNIAAGASSLSISGNAAIDELRVYPQNARMRTVTYDPLIGKTANCDENNRITYYEYDPLGRLQFIKDENKNVVKMYEYNNISNPIGCPGIYYNNMITEYFTKSNCGAGYLGKDVSYVVPANKYSASSQQVADAMAEAELLANGQTTADNSGSSNCILLHYNAYQQKYFTSQTCGVGYRGGNVLYYVPANKYYSIISDDDANQMAWEEINANGQATANDPANAVCNLDTAAYYEWTDQDPYYCFNINGQLPAHMMIQAKDVNPNSPSYTQTIWRDAGPSDQCTPNLYYNTDQSGDYYSQSCPGGQIPVPYPVSVQPGWYSSTISVEDANNQARADAQQQANWYGSCQSQMVSIEWNNPGYDDVGVEFVNVNDQNDRYYFDAIHYSSGFFRYVPSNTYNINFTPWDGYLRHDYQAGCDGWAEGFDTRTISNCVISSDCNQMFMTSHFD